MKSYYNLHSSSESIVALKKHWYHILLALAEGPAHGAEIRRRVDKHTRGSLELYPAMLYGSLEDLLEKEKDRPLRLPGRRGGGVESVLPAHDAQLVGGGDRGERVPGECRHSSPSARTRNPQFTHGAVGIENRRPVTRRLPSIRTV